MKTYAIPGETEMHMGRCPEGGVEMASPRPDTGWIAQPDGTWLKPFELHNTECKTRMYSTLAEGYTYYGKTYCCFEDDIMKLDGALSLAKKEGATNVDVRLMDKSWHTLTVSTLETVVLKLQQHYRDVWKTKCQEVDSWGS